jgi:hypothetical protein
MGMSGPYSLYALLAGAVTGGGLLLLVVALRGLPPPPPGRPPAAERTGRLLRFLTRRGAVATIAGLAVLVVTGWPVAAIASGVLVFSWSALFGGAAAERVGMQRVEALASWTESLRDTIAGAVGLEQAIPASVRAAARCSSRTCVCWWTGCAPGCRCRRRCSGSPTTWTTPAPTSSWPR